MPPQKKQRDPLTGQRRSLDANLKGGSDRVPGCLRNRRRIGSSFLRLCPRVSLSPTQDLAASACFPRTRCVCDARRGPQCGSCSTRESERAPTRAIIGRLQQDSSPISFLFFFFFFFLFRPGPIAPSSGGEKHCKYVMQTGKAAIPERPCFFFFSLSLSLSVF